ncbi:putative ABC transport system permease protein [Myroides gitamensis]|uniref:Macrolide export ATP-binding/permease protein MacB n=1 Tax=Myroides odoratus TaxID=256 RepID=A0A378U7H8_MYROD|nr:ABC transporter permease [Myroides odoratus]MCS4239532.1 putative ABC transport system permease protein [Myroides odoratus]MDH6601380.1 putative ABC transport system permease protein [Myroides gitamensis]QQU02619.1 ABC transporter permease [Myroides odoratus]STZ70163.1 Macrolide export ATP-binding/permease protein MacB [Myroides odoratus]
MWKITLENIKIATTSIKSQLLRTFITVFIIAIGIWALVGILSVVSALKNTILADFSSMGANTFTISQYDTAGRIAKNQSNQVENPPITYAQAQDFKERYSYPFSAVSLSFNAATNIEIKNDYVKTDPEISIVGCDENYLSNSGLLINNGRGLSYTDCKNNHFVCVVGSDFSKNMFKEQSPIDQVISIRGYKFKIVGILKEQGSTFGQNEDQRVFIPIQIARNIFNTANINYTIKVGIQQEGLLNQAIDQATLDFRISRNLAVVNDSNFGIERSDDMLRSLEKQIGMLNIAAWLIGMITILGSSIALMNIMLVSVTERTKEIGIRKSLGAKRKTIAQQFFTETLIIGQLGGLLGTILGIGTAYLMTSILHFTFAIPWSAILAAFITTLVVAVISGLYPAIKASKLDPVEALRYE